MSDLHRWEPNQAVPTSSEKPAIFQSRHEREVGRAIDRAQSQQLDVYNQHQLNMQKVAHKAQEAKLKTDVIFALGEHTMDRLEVMDAHRRSVAGIDPELNTLMMNIELNTTAAAARVQRNLSSDW